MIKANPRVSLNRHKKISPSSMSLTAEHNHHITFSLDDETKGLIKRLDIAIEYISEILEKTTQLPTEKIETDEPAELSVNIPDDLITPQKKYNVIPKQKCNDVGNIKWWEDGEGLHIKYKSGIVDTDWETMKDLSVMGVNDRFGAIRDILGEKFTANKRTAYSQFAEHLSQGRIKAPAANPLEFDPYAPMLSGLGLTSTAGDFGNGEED